MRKEKRLEYGSNSNNVNNLNEKKSLVVLDQALLNIIDLQHLLE